MTMFFLHGGYYRPKWGSTIYMHSISICYIYYITDPPSEVKITTPSDVEEILILNKGFREKTIEVSAESNATINCSGVSITWSPTKGKPQSCQAEGKGNIIISRLSQPCFCQLFQYTLPLIILSQYTLPHILIKTGNILGCKW